jgi:hypothetical protein
MSRGFAFLVSIVVVWSYAATALSLGGEPLVSI